MQNDPRVRKDWLEGLTAWSPYLSEAPQSLKQQDNTVSTPRAKENISTSLSPKCSCPQFTATVSVNREAQPFPGGDSACWDSPGLCPDSAPADSPSCSRCLWSPVLPPPALISQPSTRIQALQYHIRTHSCQFSPQRVKLGLFSSSFITFSCSQFHHCSTALHAVFLGTAEKPVLWWGQQVQGPTGACASSALQSPVIWISCYLWWCLSYTRYLRVHREQEKEFSSVASEASLVTENTLQEKPFWGIQIFILAGPWVSATTGEAYAIPLPISLILILVRGGVVELLKYVGAQNV